MSADPRERSFQFRECLGAGGFGEVYRATMVSPGGLRNEVAVKILRAAGGDAIRRLRDEGKLLAALRHPAILRAHDLAGVDGKVALVTEYVDGDDLARLVTGPDRLPLRPLLEVVGNVAEALHVAFSTVPVDGTEPLRLVHRDVKPSNVRIGRHGEIKLLDFGIAWSEDAEREAKTNANATVGSLAYMAPERFRKAPLRSASDVYGLGCTLFEGISGDRLVEDPVPVEMFRRAGDAAAHDAFVAERLSTLPEVPDALRGLLEGMLAFDPGARPAAGDVASALERLADAAPGPRLKPWCRERRWPDVVGTKGPLTGATLTERPLTTGPHTFDVTQTTLDVALHTASVPSPRSQTFELEDEPPPPPPARRTRWGLVAGGVVAAFAAAASVVWALSGPDPATPIPAPSPVVEVASEAPPPEPIAAREEAPAPPVVAPPVEEPPPEPVRKRPVAKVAPALTTFPAPEPAPAAPAPAPPGIVRVQGDAKVELRTAGGSFAAGDLSPGRYEVWADFGAGPYAQGRVDVVSGATATIRCNKLKYACTVEY
jgi:serine/threonine protein kinase